MSNMQQSNAETHNAHSSLLTTQENEQLFNILGKKCVSLSTAIVQVYFALPQSPSKWTKMYCGVACFIKDNQNRSYYIRVYDISKRQQIWEQELYNQFRYYAPKAFFHTFATDDCHAALNFANEVEASSFKEVVAGKIQRKERRKTERRRQNTVRQAGAMKAPPGISPISPSAISPTSASPMHTVTVSKPVETVTTNKKKEKDKKKKEKGKKLTKFDIGLPSEFRHVGHIGWDPDKGFDTESLDPDVKALFDDVGISESQLKDKDMSKFIHDFIESQGGLEAVKKDRSQRARAPPPPPPPEIVGTTPPPPPHGSGGAPPPPRGSAPPPLPPGRGALPQIPISRTKAAAPPPPPPTSRGVSQPPPPPPPGIPGARSESFPPPPASMGGRTPPPPPGPPPPPMAGAPPPPPPPGPPPTPISETDGGQSRGALLSQIQSGATLKRVDPSEQRAALPADPRSNLLSQIRGGFTLKTVEQGEKPQQVAETGMAGALARALAQRNAVIHSSDEEDLDEDDFDDDDDWDE